MTRWPSKIVARRLLSVRIRGAVRSVPAPDSSRSRSTSDRLRLADGADAQSFSQVFGKPAESAVPAFKLSELRMKLMQLASLIGSENYTDSDESRQRLAKFVILNPHGQDYALQLDRLLGQTGDKDPLRDNLLPAKALLVVDLGLRAEQLARLADEFEGTDGGMHGLYELGVLRFRLWQDGQNSGPNKARLAEARTVLTRFVKLYPESIYAEQAGALLARLLGAE